MGIHSGGSPEAVSVSSFIPNPFCREQFFLFFSVSPSSQFILRPLPVPFGIGLLFQRFDPGLFL
jgi:hypothetical protein